MASNSNAMSINAKPLTNKSDSDVISVSEAARKLGAHKNTIYKYIEGGEIPAFRIATGGHWKINKDEFEDWLQVRKARKT